MSMNTVMALALPATRNNCRGEPEYDNVLANNENATPMSM